MNKITFKKFSDLEAAVITSYSIHYTKLYDVVFEEPQLAITEGQFVAWHHGDEVLGSGVIS